MGGVNRAWVAVAPSPSLELVLRGAGHHSFTDLTYVAVLKPTGMVGSIDGARAGAACTAATLAFMAAVREGGVVDVAALHARFVDLVEPGPR
jgi:hypothetical protein